MARLLNAPSETLPREQRIAKRRDFVRAYEEGRKEISRYIVVFTLENGLGHPRIGVTATRKIGKAHERNRMKRWVREVYRRERSALGLNPLSVDFVVNVKTNAVDANFRDFAEDLKRVLRRSAARRSATAKP
ncbi:MAG TPA: ribonuclease P protein component [Thermoanaerobaculia bacterium]